MIAVCQNTAISVDANIDKTLEWATASQKPWFLKSEELYLVAKKAIEDLKLNDFTAVQQSISVIDKSTATLLRSSDSVLKTSFSSEEGFSLINTVDTLLASAQSVLHSADGKVDLMTTKLVESLKAFKGATKSRLESIYSQISSTDLKTTAFTALAGAHKLVKEKFPGPTESVEALASQASATADYVKTTATTKYEEIKMATTTKVVSALEASKPYVCKAIEMGQPIVLPIVEKTSPIVAPYVDYVQKALEGNKTIAPYFEVAKTTTISVIDTAQKYYTPAPAVVAATPAAAAPSNSSKPIVPATISQKSAKAIVVPTPKVETSE